MGSIDIIEPRLDGTPLRKTDSNNIVRGVYTCHQGGDVIVEVDDGQGKTMKFTVDDTVKTFKFDWEADISAFKKAKVTITATHVPSTEQKTRQSIDLT